MNNKRVEHDVWVTKCLNYSDKFGVGYLLSNGLIGVIFNDLTKLVLDPNNYHLDYFELDEFKREKKNQLVRNTLDYPDFLLKKFKILIHFGALIKKIEPKMFLNLVKN